jgi:hypothetical protein
MGAIFALIGYFGKTFVDWRRTNYRKELKLQISIFNLNHYLMLLKVFLKYNKK